MSAQLEMIGAWLEIGHELAKRIGLSLDILQVEDVWKTARGLRVAYRVLVSFGRYGEECQETLPCPSDVADEALRRIGQ